CTMELLGELKKWQEDHGYPYRFSTEASIDLAAKDDLLNAMADVGFNMVFIGLETPDEGSLAATGKVQNLKGDIREAVRKIQRLGIEVTAGFIIGFDTDPPDIFQRQVDFIQELAVPTAMVGLLMALPNTRLWQRLEREGRMKGLSSGDNTHHTELNFETMLPESLLEEGYRYVLSRVYDPRRYFDRAYRFLKMHPRKEVEHASQAKEPIKWDQIAAFGRSLLFQTFSRYGFWYVWYLIRAVAVRPNRIVRAVTLAVQGHHYFVITRQTLAQAGVRNARKLRDPSAALTRSDVPRGNAIVRDGTEAVGGATEKKRRPPRREVAFEGVHGTLHAVESSTTE
ncbi:MAG: B12-binding domain-containing radical SAM protein, partial [Spirochaetota bacterium]